MRRQTYRDQAWNIFQAMHRLAAVPSAAMHGHPVPRMRAPARCTPLVPRCARAAAFAARCAARTPPLALPSLVS